MLTYQYTARNPQTGERIKAVVEAQSELDASKLIRKEGLVPLDIKLASSGKFNFLKRFKRVKTKDRVLFARQLSTLINAGLPLLQSLHSVADQTASKPLRVIINGVINEIEAGQALSVALAKYPETFNQVFVSLVAAGEASGTLDKALERIALQQEKDAEIISKVRGAMVYPAIVLFVMIMVVTFMLVKVLPQVEVLYKAFPGASLPLVTSFLLGLSHFVVDFWWAIVLVVGVIGFFTFRWSRTVGGKRVVDAIKLNTPTVKVLFSKMYMARFARTGSTLTSAGVPLLQVLQIASDAVVNVYIQESIKKASEKVKAGKSLGEALVGDPYFLPLVPNMLRIGEQSGSMDQMMAKTADYYEKEVDDAIKNISTIIEPVMMVLLGVMALIIVAAILMPVYGLAGSGAVR